MAEELAATRAALRAREMRGEASPPPAATATPAGGAPLAVAPKGKHAGGGGLLGGLFGCAGGREPAPRAYAVTLHPALPAPALPLSSPRAVPTPPPRSRPPTAAPLTAPLTLDAALQSPRNPHEEGGAALSPDLSPPTAWWDMAPPAPGAHEAAEARASGAVARAPRAGARAKPRAPAARKGRAPRPRGEALGRGAHVPAAAPKLEGEPPPRVQPDGMAWAHGSYETGF